MLMLSVVFLGADFPYLNWSLLSELFLDYSMRAAIFLFLQSSLILLNFCFRALVLAFLSKGLSQFGRNGLNCSRNLIDSVFKDFSIGNFSLFCEAYKFYGACWFSPTYIGMENSPYSTGFSQCSMTLKILSLNSQLTGDNKLPYQQALNKSKKYFSLVFSSMPVNSILFPSIFWPPGTIHLGHLLNNSDLFHASTLTNPTIIHFIIIFQRVRNLFYLFQKFGSYGIRRLLIQHVFMRLYVIQVWNVFINISQMDPQVKIDPNHNNNQLKPDKIIAMMRVTKKTDPLFKQLKKLKNALDSIGYEKISLLPTRVVIVFHFGLGNELDFQFIRKTHPPQYCIKNSPILPGKSYCYLTFTTAAEAEEYLHTKYAPILQGVPAAYTELGYENLSRVMISMFNKQQKTNIAQQMLDIENAPLHYEPGQIPGLLLIQQFITKEEELELLETIDKAQWSKLNNRRVQHYGYQFKYGRNEIDRDEKFQKPMPDFIQKILARLEKLDFLPGYRFDQMTINDYFSGDGIPAHFDTHSPFQEHFVAISLLSGLVMQWRKYDGTQQQVYLHPRSLIVFAGEGRYAWTHAIACRKVDKVGGQLKHRSRRISITLRKIKFTQCKCPYYFYCDSQGYDQKTMKKNNPLLLKYLAQNVNTSKLGNKSSEQIYKTYVLDAYKGFGFDFHNKSIGLVQKFMDQEFNNEQNKNLGLINILDVGCGNGEYLDVIEKAQYKTNYHYIGIQICQTMKPFDNKIIMDGLSLCFREGSFDLVLCVAVLHHLTSVEQRIQMLKELNRVTTELGTIIISVFGHEQKSNVYKDQDILLDYCVPQFKAKKEINSKEQESQPRIQKRGIVYQRYYHLFKEDQIRQLCESANLQISKLQTDKQNIILVCHKAKAN